MFFQVLREVYASKHTIIILDCNKDMIEEVLTQAQQIGMISEDFYYLLTSLDAHTVDLHSFKVLKMGSDKITYCLGRYSFPLGFIMSKYRERFGSAKL